jgi:cysteinyl-tRNA synthetase
MMLTHYRQPLNWTEENLKESKKILDKWYSFLSTLEAKDPNSRDVSNKVLKSLCDDINTPQAIAALHKIFKDCKDSDQNSIDLFLNSAQFIGLMNNNPSEWLNWGKENFIDEEQLEILIQKRDEARSEGKYEEADKIRGKIENMGIILEDKDGKTSWRLK